MKTSFIDDLITTSKTHADRNAFCIQQQFYTDEILWSKITAIRQKINEKYRAEQNIGLLAINELETYAAYIAIMLSGKTCVPVNPAHPAARIKQIIEQAGLNTIFSKNTECINNEIEITGLKGLEINTGPIPVINSTNNANAYLLFTSGSTGIPKGVPISFYNLDSFVSAFNALGYQVSEQDRFLQQFDLTFDLSIMSFLIPLCIGACVYTISDTGMKYTNIYGVLEEHKITFALMVPSVINSLRPYFSEISLPELRYALFCGEALHKNVVTEWMNCVPNALIENVYGPTEATIFCMSYNVSRGTDMSAYNGIVSIGKPMQNMEAIIVNEQFEPIQDAEKGELCLHGAQLTPGYLDEEKNKVAFFMLGQKKYYRTGDIVFKNDAGDFMYCGRLDHQVKIQGYRIELSEIEYHMRSISGSANAIALLISDDNGNNRIDAIFEGGQMNTEEILNQLKTKIPSYMIPSQVHYLTTFPLNQNGKTDRNALKKMIL